MSDEDLMIHILNNLPLEYDLQVEKMEEKINQDDNPIPLEKDSSTLSLKFTRLNVSNEDNTDYKEIGKDLVTSKLKGRWNNCGKYGHKKQDCRVNGDNDKRKDNKGNKSRFYGTCNYCNKFGHKQEDFYEKQRNEQGYYNKTCNYCNKFGHKQEDLREKQRYEQANITEGK